MNTIPFHMMRKLMITLGIIIGTFVSAFAQVSNLNFTQTTASYTEITGGTVVATASGTTGAASLDDVVYSLTTGTIPFTFTFDNSGYTGLNISTNGFLTFGTVAPAASGSTTGYTPLSATTGYAGCVSALGRNLNAYFTGVSTQTGEIRYQTLGAAPNRTFVVQWKNFKVFTYTGAYGPVLNFQVRLSETTNAVEIVYNCSGAFTSTTAQVGLRGPNNVFPTNINNRQVAAASNTWITSVAGTANTSTCEFSSSLLPPIGLTYRFAQNPCPNPQNATATNVTQSAAQLTWTTTGGGGTFTIEYGLSGFTPGSGTVQSGVSPGVTISGLTANTAYQYYVTQNCGTNGNSQRVGPISFSTGGPGEDCATALLIPVANNLGSCVYTTVSSGVSSNGPNAICSDVNGNTPNDDRWFKFVAPATGDQLVLYTTAGTVNDWVMEVWSACPGSGSVIKCSDDVNGAMPEIRLCQNEYTAGNTYYVRLWTYSSTLTGTANLCVYKDLECPIPPVNDECVDARVLQVNAPGACPAASQIYTTKYATPNIDGATCDAGTKRDVWFVFNTGNFSDISMTISPVTATTLKAQLLFECGGFELSCYNPANGTYTFTNLNPVADYIIRVWSDTLTAGTFNICLFSNCTAPTATIGSGTTICSGQSATLPITFTGTAPWTFTYRNDVTGNVSSVTTSSNPYNLVVSPTVTTGYTLLSVSDALCSGAASGTALVTVGGSGQTPVVSGNSSVCRGQSGIVYSTPTQSGATYSWTVPTGVTITAGQGTNSITTTWSSTAVSGNVSVTVNSTCGSNTGSVAVTVGTAPTVPTVSGSASVCRGNTSVGYSITAQTGVTYSWTVPTGVTITAGQGTNSITTSWSASAVSGNVAVTVSNSCGSQSGSLAVTALSAPTAPTVSGNSSVCPNQTGVVYSITAQTGVTYSWTVPTGVTITAGQGTNSITTSWGASAVSGNVSVTVSNSCGSQSGSQAVTISTTPAAPVVSGPATACLGQTGLVYSTTAQTGVTYSWTVPTGVTITAGQGTNSITTTWSSTAVSGNVTLTITSTCGSNTGSVAVTVGTAPTVPTVSGSASVCRGNTSVGYSITAQTGVTYSWTVPTGVTITAGQGTNSITTSWSASAVSGNVAVTVSNSCGSQSGSLAVTALSAPTAPTVSGNSSVCPNQTGVVYSITAQTGVTYSWTVPTGVTITAGQGTNSITTSWGASAVSGNVSVTVSNSCGSQSGSQAVTISTTPAAPVVSGPATACLGQTGLVYSTTAQTGVTYSWTVPTGVTITAGQGTNSITTTWSSTAVSGNVTLTITSTCGSNTGSVAVTVGTAPTVPTVSGSASVCRGNTSVGYSITAQTGVTYSWTVPTGVTITAGQGTNSITTSWSASAVSGNVAVTVSNSCGSQSGSLAVTALSAPTAPTVSGNSSVCPNQTGVVYSITAQTGVTYSWTVPTGVTITAGQGTNSITTSWGASAVSGNVSVTVSNSCGSQSGSQAVTISTTPAAPVVSGPATACLGQTGLVYSTTAQTGVTYSWTVPTGVTITAGQGTNSITTTWSSTAVSGNVTLTITSTCGSNTGSVAVTVGTAPTVPTVSGSASVCRGNTSVGYSITAQTGVTYSWTVPTGVTITAGQGTNSITTSWSASAVSGNVAVTVSNSCGSQSGSLAVTALSAPTAPTVSGNSSVCPNQTGVVYSITAQTGVTYSWTVPTGVTITAGQGTNSITTSWGASAVSGNVSVTVSNSCGSQSGSQAVTISTTPAAPVVSGPATACLGQTGLVYSTTAQTGVTYSWTVPTGVTITAGQGTNSITTTWSSTAVSGNVTLTITSTCGSNTGSVAVTVGTAPTVPTVSGSASVCRGNTSVGYSITAQTGVTYSWTVPTGVTITAGQGTNSITTSWSASAVSGNVAVTVSNSCGSQSGSLAVTALSAPTAPTVSGNSSVCPNQTGVVYSITAQTGVTYSWTVPTGVTITAGQGTNSITTSWGASAVSGNVSVTVSNSCGSQSGSQAVTISTTPAAPVVSGPATACLGQTGLVYSTTAQTGVTYSWTVPTGVTITAGQGTNSITTTWSSTAVSGNVTLTITSTCGSNTGSVAVTVGTAPTVPTVSGSASVCRGNTSVGYSITAQTGVTYSWTVPTGVTITSGQGTNSITTSWSASAVSGNVAVTVSNSCGSQSGSLAVTALSAPTAPTVSGNSSVCPNQTGVVYSITAQTGVTYSWTVPTGVTITAGQGTNSITTSWGASAVSGNVSVTVSNSCGSQSGSQAVTISTVPLVPTISGSTTVCRGQTSVNYSTTAQPGVTYTWTVPAGASIVSGQGTNAIVTSWSASAVSGNVVLSVSNSCGSQTGSSSINVITGPTAPAVSGNNSVCAGQTGVVYSTTAQSGMTYTWTVPTGVTITSGQGTNSITTTWSASAIAGNVTVVVSNICNSLSGSVTVAVNPAFSIGSITGPAQLCPPQIGITYSVSAQSGATFNWTVPTGVTITSGQGTNSILTSWSSTAISGNVSVTGSSACGSGSTSLPVSVSGGSLVVQPITGPDLLCRPATGAVYTVQIQPGVTYSWTVPSGVTITAGQGTNSITTSWSSTALSGGVSVLQSSTCGSGTASFLVTLRTSLPVSPGNITGNAVVCRGDQFVYSIRKVSTADYYIWTPGVGMTINGSALPFNTPDTAVVVTFTTAYNGDSLRVNTGNCKGVGVTPKALFVARGTTAPATPGFITGQSNALCGPSTFTYSINTTIANAVSYTWRTSISGALINGLPSPVTVPASTPGVTVTYPANFNNTGTLYVKSNNGCGSSTERSLSLKAKPDPATAIFGKDTVCRSTTEPYSVTPRQGVTIWTWTVPTSVTISSGQNTANVNLAFNSTTGSRSIRVTAKNACGSSTAFTKSVLAIACLRMAEQIEQHGLALDAYPNPANDVLFVSMESEHEGAVTIQLQDLSGRLVYQEMRNIHKGASLLQLDASGLVNGMYILSVHGQGFRASERISISH